MAKYVVDGADLTDIADAIRSKTGESGSIVVKNMASKIDGIEAGSGGGEDTRFADLIEGNLTTIEDSSVSKIGNYAFYSCTSLTSVNFPAATTIGGSAFHSCTGLTSANFPAATTIGKEAFSYCTSLTSVSFPAATEIHSWAFQYCKSLTSVSFPVATSISGWAFQRCTLLTSFYLAGSSLCTLANSYAFSYTPIASGTGYIYVPSSLVASYKAATNWTYYSAQIRAI